MALVFVGLSSLVVILVFLTIPLVGRQLDLLATKIPQWLHAVQDVVIPWMQQTLDLPEDSLSITQFTTVLTENWTSAGAASNVYG